MDWSANQKKITQIEKANSNIAEIKIIRVINLATATNSAPYLYGFVLVVFRFGLVDTTNKYSKEFHK